MDSFAQDLRYGWRALRTRPGFTLVAVVGAGALALLASCVPARRASRVHPARVLRSE